jgi:hypothetical protein
MVAFIGLFDTSRDYTLDCTVKAHTLVSTVTSPLPLLPSTDVPLPPVPRTVSMLSYELLTATAHN